MHPETEYELCKFCQYCTRYTPPILITSQ